MFDPPWAAQRIFNAWRTEDMQTCSNSTRDNKRKRLWFSLFHSEGIKPTITSMHCTGAIRAPPGGRCAGRSVAFLAKLRLLFFKVNNKQQPSGLKGQTAVPRLATWGRLQKQVPHHRARIKRSNYTAELNIYSLFTACLWWTEGSELS